MSPDDGAPSRTVSAEQRAAEREIHARRRSPFPDTAGDG
jgi:hypothetical protein